MMSFTIEVSLAYMALLVKFEKPEFVRFMAVGSSLSAGSCIGRNKRLSHPFHMIHSDHLALLLFSTPFAGAQWAKNSLPDIGLGEIMGKKEARIVVPIRA